MPHCAHLSDGSGGPRADDTATTPRFAVASVTRSSSCSRCWFVLARQIAGTATLAHSVASLTAALLKAPVLWLRPVKRRDEGTFPSESIHSGTAEASGLAGERKGPGSARVRGPYTA